ncbi:hypothetical protein ABFV83_14875 [Lacrimispora sp. BS-2]|uniref:Cell wall-binding protein n=1 Tax=Lacrimispora sp. BS-2 TaxID=3151850 RepID=A0AAU7PLM8_9FIRM
MKKKLLGAILSAALTITMVTPAFAEIIWTPDKLPAGYSSNEWENKDFSFYSGIAIKKDTYTYYVKDLHGNIMKNVLLAGGSKTDENGVLIYSDGHACAYGMELAKIEYFNTQPYERSAWHQDSSKPLNENGASNYWYGDTKGSDYRSRWVWLHDAPNGINDELTRAYCFDEYGYLYINTITPDGYMVNELGQLVIDGKVKTHYDGDYNTWYDYGSFAIGFLAYDRESSERVAKSVPGPLNPFF